MKKTLKPVSPLSGSRKWLFRAISILLVSACICFVEYKGISRSLGAYIFGSNEGINTSFVQQNKPLWEQIKILLLLAALFLFSYLTLLILLFELVCIPYFIFSSRWRKPCIFISYKKHSSSEKVNTYRIAQELKNILSGMKFRVLFYDFTHEKHHDEINHSIRDYLLRCDIMVAVPDPYEASYVNAEIKTAATLSKPIFIIKHTTDQVLPDTANSGHLVFSLRKLRQHEFLCLKVVMERLHRYWKSRLFILLAPLTFMAAPFAFYDDMMNSGSKGAKIIAGILTGSILLLYFNVHIEYIIYGITLLIGTLSCIQIYHTLCSLQQELFIEKIANQSVLTGENTIAYLKQAEIGDDIIKCLDRKGLKIAGEEND